MFFLANLVCLKFKKKKSNIKITKRKNEIKATENYINANKYIQYIFLGMSSVFSSMKSFLSSSGISESSLSDS